jgi:hypothetical protein
MTKTVAFQILIIQSTRTLSGEIDFAIYLTYLRCDMGKFYTPMEGSRWSDLQVESLSTHFIALLTLNQEIKRLHRSKTADSASGAWL